MRLEIGQKPSWALIAFCLVIGLVLVGFGNADRLLWRATAHGGDLPGVVVGLRSYRLPEEGGALVHIPQVAFRDADGKLRIREVREGQVPVRLSPDQPVAVLWEPESKRIAIDMPFRRHPMTSIILSLLTALGITAWLCGIIYLVRRIRLPSLAVPGQVLQDK